MSDCLTLSSPDCCLSTLTNSGGFTLSSVPAVQHSVLFDLLSSSRIRWTLLSRPSHLQCSSLSSLSSGQKNPSSSCECIALHLSREELSAFPTSPQNTPSCPSNKGLVRLPLVAARCDVPGGRPHGCWRNAQSSGPWTFGRGCWIGGESEEDSSSFLLL